MLFAAALVTVAGAAAVATAVTSAYRGWSRARRAALLAGSRIASTAVGDIEYRLTGEGGPVMLFLHGAPGGYDHGVEASAGLRVLAPSRPGYLRTPLEVGRTPQAQARALRALLDALEIDAVVVVAASGGGPAGLSFAATYPERTLGLVAIEAVSLSITLPEIPGALRGDASGWLALSLLTKVSGPKALAKAMMPDPANQARVLEDPARLARLREMVWGMWPMSQRLAGWENDAAQLAALELPVHDIAAPTLVIHGTADANVPFSHAVHLCDRVEGAQLHAIEGADHFMPASHKDELEAVMAAFLEEVLGAARP